MRKVFEITFGGDDFNVLVAQTRASALEKLGEHPKVVLIDTSLDGDDGYALCKEIRAKDAAAVIFLLTSKFTPYDAAKGKDAGADDNLDKPFDTQAALDKVRKALLAKEGGPAVAAAPAEKPAAAAAPAAKPAPAAEKPAPVAAAEKPAPIAEKPVPAKPAAPAPVAAAAASAVNGQMAGKLGDLGLSPQQTDAILALSREVVERVVWEVVPQLAETIIKEEIARLTR